MSWWSQRASDVVTLERMDADHFQPKYIALEKAIRAGNGEAVRLGTLLSYARRGAQPEYFADGEVLVINSQHVGEHLINIDGAARTNEEFWDKRKTARAGRLDILMNSTGVGTIGRVNCVLHDQRSVVDNHVTILRVNDLERINPLFLSVFLNSRLGREQTYKWQSGSSGQLEIYPEDIKRFWVCLPSKPVQDAIAKKLQAAYEAERRASDAAAAAESAALGLAAFGPGASISAL
jgi:type I restriction enzyme M protein